MRKSFIAVCFAVLVTAGHGSPSAMASDSETSSISGTMLQQRIEANEPGFVVLDVRTPEEYAAGHVPGAVNVPHDRIAEKLDSLTGDRDREIIVYCRSGRRSAMAIDALRAAGFERVTHLEGDMIGWQEAQRPLATQAHRESQTPAEQPVGR